VLATNVEQGHIVDGTAEEPAIDGAHRAGADDGDAHGGPRLGEAGEAAGLGLVDADGAGGIDDLLPARLVERHALGEALGAGAMLDLARQQDLAARLARRRALDPGEIAR